MNGPASPFLVDTGAVWEETPHLSVCLRGGPSSTLWVCEIFCGSFSDPVLADEESVVTACG